MANINNYNEVIKDTRRKDGNGNTEFFAILNKESFFKYIKNTKKLQTRDIQDATSIGYNEKLNSIRLCCPTEKSADAISNLIIYLDKLWNDYINI